MNKHSFDITEKKLGFKIDKTKSTPTISEITPGGALEEKLIESCSTIKSGCTILSIAGENIENLNGNQAIQKIKSYTERPINIVINSPRNNNISHISNKMTIDEMNKQSEELTQKSLKDLVQIHKENQKRKLMNNDSESDYDSDYDSDYKDNISNKKYKELENKHHLLKLELLNCQIMSDEQNELMKKQLNPIKSINDILCHINTLNNRSQNINKIDKFKKYSSEEMSNKLEKMNNEYNSYFDECEIYLKKVELHEIKNCIIHLLDKEKENLEKLNVSYKCKINMKFIYEILELVGILVLLLSIFAGLVFIKNNRY